MLTENALLMHDWWTRPAPDICWTDPLPHPGSRTGRPLHKFREHRAFSGPALHLYFGFRGPFHVLVYQKVLIWRKD